MPYKFYSHKFKEEIPLLDDDEWEQFSPFLTAYWRDLKNHRPRSKYETPKFREAAQKYFLMTGYRPLSFDYQNYFRLSQYGRPCENCGKPFRTPESTMCAECGFELQDGEKAGPITENFRLSHWVDVSGN